MGGLFGSDTKQVPQQPITTALPTSEVTRLASITGQQQNAALKKKQLPRTVLGVPIQQVGSPSPTTYGAGNG